MTPIPRSQKRLSVESSLPLTSAPSLSRLRTASDKRPGEIGALLRREVLYSSQLGRWRKQFRAGELLEQKKRGPKPEPESTKRIQQLEREVARLQQRQQTLDEADLRTPHRFTKRPPQVQRPPMEVWINPPLLAATAETPRAEPTGDYDGEARPLLCLSPSTTSVDR